MNDAFFRPEVGDYVIRSNENGAISIRPHQDGLVITANSNAAPLVEALLGKPAGPGSPLANRPLAWRIDK